MILIQFQIYLRAKHISYLRFLCLLCVSPLFLSTFAKLNSKSCSILENAETERFFSTAEKQFAIGTHNLETFLSVTLQVSQDELYYPNLLDSRPCKSIATNFKSDNQASIYPSLIKCNRSSNNVAKICTFLFILCQT